MDWLATESGAVELEVPMDAGVITFGCDQSAELCSSTQAATHIGLFGLLEQFGQLEVGQVETIKGSHG